MSLTAELQLMIRMFAKRRNTSAGILIGVDEKLDRNLVQQKQYENGTADGQISYVSHLSGTLGPSLSMSFDLTALDPGDGSTVSAAKVSVLAFALKKGGASSVGLGGAAANAWTAPFGNANDIKIVEAGENDGFLIEINGDDDGYPVSGSSKNLALTNNDGSETASYDLVLAYR